MFQLAPILWLQAFESPALTLAMRAVSDLGYTLVYVAFLLLLSFWLRLKPTLGVLLGLLLAAAATEGLKNAIALPRPSDVCADLQQPGLVTREAAAAHDTQGFWGLPGPAAPSAMRPAADANYGFPSGHASAATAFALGLVLFFGRRRFLAFAVGWPIVMGLSRIYLGRHFLADVLGGVAVGGASALLAWLWLRWLDRGRNGTGWRRRRAALTGMLALGFAAWAVATPAFEPQSVGRAAGVAGAYMVLVVAGFPADAGEPWQRGARMACAGLIFFAANALAEWLLDAAGWDRVRVAAFLAGIVHLGGALLAAVGVGRRMGWFQAF